MAPVVVVDGAESSSNNAVNLAEAPNTAGIGAGLFDAGVTAVAKKTTYVEIKPIMIASSAHITEEIQINCLKIGFDKVSGIPI